MDSLLLNSSTGFFNITAHRPNLQPKNPVAQTISEQQKEVIPDFFIPVHRLLPCLHVATPEIQAVFGPDCSSHLYYSWKTAARSKTETCQSLSCKDSKKALLTPRPALF